MKIMVNYDLIDKAREAKTGFSLHKFTVLMGFINGITMPAVILGAELGNEPVVETLDTIFRMLFISGSQSLVNSSFGKYYAVEKLRELSIKLNDICIETDTEMLMETYKYDVRYKVDFESFPPKIVQDKYMMVPVHNDWGNNERSVKQEHVIGSRNYVLSYGEPEKKKSYSYARRRAIQ